MTAAEPVQPAVSELISPDPSFPPATPHARVQQPLSGRWVYAVGQVVPRFPDLGVEKEFTQAADGVAPGEAVGTDQLRAVLSQPDNAHLARLICWTFVAGDVDVFMVRCREAAEAARLVESLPSVAEQDRTVQVIIGTAGPAEAQDPGAAAGLPVVTVDHMLCFPLGEFVEALVGEVEQQDLDLARQSARDLFARLTRRSGGWGVSDVDRARNYVAMRYSQMYHLVFTARKEGKVLFGVDARPLGSPGARRVVAVRLAFRDRRTDVSEQYQCLVDVTDRFPFLAASLTVVYD